MADDLGRKPIAGIAEASERRHPTRLPILVCQRKPVPQVDGALRGWRDAEQIESAELGAGGGGEDGGEAIAPEADDIAGERGEITEQGVEAVHREWFALCRVSAFAGGLALRRR